MENLQSNLTDKAHEIAMMAHTGQLRKISGEPYIGHPEAVAHLVREHGGSEEAVAAAYLHDVLEDATDKYPREQMLSDFGQTVTQLVDSVSEEKLDATGAVRPWHQRKEDYIAKISNESDETLLISLADKVHNLTSIMDGYDELGPTIWDKFKALPQEQYWYYSSLLDIFAQRLGTNHKLVKQLSEQTGRLAALVLPSDEDIQK